MKQDYANAYYNLGHALESKGGAENFQSALQAYKIVEQLVTTDTENLKRIRAEIDALNKKIAGGQAQPDQAALDQAAADQASSDLNVNEAPTLPERDPQAEIQGPPTSKITPTATPSPTKASPNPNL